MAKIVIVGGGISGLSAAAHLARDGGGAHEVTLLERETEVGGKARTLVDGEWSVETGPTAFLADSPTLDTLITNAGLDARRITADEGAARRYLVRRGKLREVSPNPLRLVCSGLITPLGALRVMAEPLIPRASEERAQAESVWKFAKRRFGREVADRFIAPMVLGIFAGDSQRLSLPAAFPRLAAVEREHRSLILALISKRKSKRRGGPQGPSAPLTSFRSGLEELPRALAETPGITVRRGSQVEGIVARNGAERGWRVAVAGESPIDTDAVILAGEAWAMAPILRESAPEIASALGEIDYPPVAVVALGFDRKTAERIPVGFGALIARGQGYRLLGSLWDGRIFPERRSNGNLLIRSIYGGAVDREVAVLDDGALIALAREEIGRLLGITDPPIYTRAVRWPQAIPQYNLGHLERVATIRDHLGALPGLAIAGNSLDGVAFGKAAESGVRAAEAIESFLMVPARA